MSDLSMMDVTRYEPLHRAHELAVRLSEVHTVIQVVEACGASPELTEAVVRLGQRMRDIQADMISACLEAMTPDAKDAALAVEIYGQSFARTVRRLQGREAGDGA